MENIFLYVWRDWREMTMPPSGMLIIQLIIHNRLPLYLCTNHTNQAATTLAVTLTSQKDCMSKQGRGGFKDITFNISDRLLLCFLFVCLSCVLDCFQQCSNPQIHNFSQGYGAFHLVTCPYIFQGNIREWGRKSGNMTRHNVTKTLPQSRWMDFHWEWLLF